MAAVENIPIYYHPDFKGKHVNETVKATAHLTEDIFNHARIARYGMGHIPNKITFPAPNSTRVSCGGTTTG